MTITNVNGHDIAYDDTGTGTPVILLHGYPFNRSLWRKQAAAFSDTYRLITPDLRGHGESEATDSVTLNEMAVDVAGLLDTLGIERAVVGGLSMGGYVALAFQKQFPDRVRALVLADTRAQSDNSEARAGREQQAQTAIREGMAPIAEGMLSKLFAPETPATNSSVVSFVREMMLKTNPKGAAAALRAMAVREDHTEHLGEIRIPTLILVGAHDVITPSALSEEMHRRIAGSQLEIIAGAGHVSNLERPDEFNRALKTFLDALPEDK
jgi:3-oxoadipate enol-lactonase